MSGAEVKDVQFHKPQADPGPVTPRRLPSVIPIRHTLLVRSWIQTLNWAVFGGVLPLALITDERHPHVQLQQFHYH